MPRPLPSDIIALLQHVELRQGGWHHQLFERLTISALASHEAPSARAAIRADIIKLFGVPITERELSSAISRLIQDKRVVLQSDGSLQVTKEEVSALVAAAREAEQLETLASEAFLAALPDECKAATTLEHWAQFRDHFLLPLVRQAGARLGEVLTPGPDGDLAFSLEQYAQAYPDSIQEAIVGFARSYIHIKPPTLSAFMLALLHTQFLMEAGRMAPEHVEELSARLRQQVAFRLLLDTNVLFSLLGLRSNPNEEVVRELRTLIASLVHRVKVKLLVLPDTVEEFRDTLAATEQRLSGHTFTPIVSRAALARGSATIADSFAVRMMELAAGSGRNVTAASFLGPIRRDPLGAIRAAGAELHNEDLSAFRSAPAFKTDVENQLSFERRRYGVDAKDKKAIEHDVLLWHAVSRKRAVIVSSPLDATWWCVTADYRLMGFDAHKQRDDKDPTPECIDPPTLIQLLHLWQPRTREAEQALLASLRATVPPAEHQGASGATDRILEVLWRFQLVDGMGEDGVAALLASDALRSSISQEGDEKRQVELVRLEIDRHLETLRVELEAAEGRLSELTTQVEQLNQRERVTIARASELELAVSETQQEVESLRAQLEGSKASEEELRLGKREAIEAFTGQLEAVRGRAARVGRMAFVLTQAVAIPVLSFAALSFNPAALWRAGHSRGVVTLAMIWLGCLYGWCALQPLLWRRVPEVHEWRFFHRFESVRRAIAVLVGICVTALIGEIVVRAAF